MQTSLLFALIHIKFLLLSPSCEDVIICAPIALFLLREEESAAGFVLFFLVLSCLVFFISLWHGISCNLRAFALSGRLLQLLMKLKNFLTKG